jgi:hypothetical protein
MQKKGKKIFFKPTIRNDTLHGISNANGVAVLNFATSKNLSRVQCFHITTFINTLGLLLMGKHESGSSCLAG